MKDQQGLILREYLHVLHLQGSRNGASSDQGGQEVAAAADKQAEAERDADAEEELTSAARSDPFAAYDVEVALEGEAIREYMALLDGAVK